MDGYKIIDFKGIDVSSGEASIPGLFDAISESNKPMIVCNLNFGGTIAKPFTMGLVNTLDDGGSLYHVFTIVSPNGFSIVTIQEDDTVIITEN